MSDFLGIAQKVRQFQILVAQNLHDLLVKIGEHIDGTSGAKRGCNTNWTLVRILRKTVFPGPKNRKAGTSLEVIGRRGHCIDQEQLSYWT